MQTLFKAGTAFFVAALLAGIVPPLSPQWRAVAADLHQAAPPAQFQSKAKAILHSLLPNKKG